MTALDRHARPRLAKKARVRLDRVTGKRVLLYPERGLVLNDAGARILALCDGARSVADIAALIAAETEGLEPATVEHDLLAFLERLATRGLLAPEA